MTACTEKKNSNDGETILNQNEIQLNVDENDSKAGQSDPSPDVQPETEVQPVISTNTRNEKFISGRTELLSLRTKELLTPEGFSIGEIFVNYTGSIEEENIISTCISFFKFFKSEKMFEFVHPARVLELRDYCEYFLNDTMVFDNYLFGKPQLKGKEAHLKMIFYPDFTTAFVYLSKDENQWLISGFEVDLRVGKQDGSVEKWAPTVKSPIFGNY